MSRRTALPGADELFRVTGRPEGGDRVAPAAPDRDLGSDRAPGGMKTEVAAAFAAEQDGDLAPTRMTVAPREAPTPPRSASPRRRVAVARRTSRDEEVDRRSTGRERHEEKITVYVSGEELFDLEHARLVLRGEHGIVTDRGRLVREAVAVVLADLEAKGAQSILVRRLGQ